MINRLRGLGIVLGLIGIAFIAAGGFSFFKVQEGTASLQAFSAAQGVELTYNEDGQLVDRGETEGAQSIMALLTDDWNYPVATSELDPNDPVVNTASEYMFQMATVAYHTLHGTQTVVLDEDVEYNGELFTAGTYEFAVDGRYWNDFDREHPIEGPARAQAWTGVAHALIAQLGVGTVDRLHAAAWPRTGRPVRGRRRDVPSHRCRPGLGNSPGEGHGPGPSNGERDRLALGRTNLPKTDSTTESLSSRTGSSFVV